MQSITVVKHCYHIFVKNQSRVIPLCHSSFGCLLLLVILDFFFVCLSLSHFVSCLKLNRVFVCDSSSTFWFFFLQKMDQCIELTIKKKSTSFSHICFTKCTATSNPTTKLETIALCSLWFFYLLFYQRSFISTLVL